MCRSSCQPPGSPQLIIYCTQCGWKYQHWSSTDILIPVNITSLFPFFFHTLITVLIHFLLKTYRSVVKIVHLVLTNWVSVNSSLVPQIHHNIYQNSSMTCIWNFILTIYRNHAPHLVGLNTCFDSDVANISILLN